DPLIDTNAAERIEHTNRMRATRVALADKQHHAVRAVWIDRRNSQRRVDVAAGECLKLFSQCAESRERSHARLSTGASAHENLGAAIAIGVARGDRDAIAEVAWEGIELPNLGTCCSDKNPNGRNCSSSRRSNYFGQA